MADWLEDDRPDQEANFAEAEELSQRQKLMAEAMKTEPARGADYEARRCPNRLLRWKS